jgi:hypothetical protein
MAVDSVPCLATKTTCDLNVDLRMVHVQYEKFGRPTNATNILLIPFVSARKGHRGASSKHVVTEYFMHYHQKTCSADTVDLKLLRTMVLVLMTLITYHALLSLSSCSAYIVSTAFLIQGYILRIA